MVSRLPKQKTASNSPSSYTGGITIKSRRELRAMERAGAIVGNTLTLLRASVVPGITTGELNRIADDNIRHAGIAAAQPGQRVGDIGAAVQGYAEPLGYGVVRGFVGHGVGRHLHEDPQVPNYGEPGKGALLRPGMCICIEPMLNIGAQDATILDDNWTVVTADGSLSAHFEHTLAITREGPKILTMNE